MFRQFEKSERLEDLERICKSSLLLPGGIDLAKLPVKAFADAQDAGNVPDWFPQWGWQTRAGYAYRSGDAKTALNYLEKSEALEPIELARAQNLPLHAMVLFKLQRVDEARQTLKEAAEFISQLQENPNLKGEHDLLFALILLREARQTIEGKAE
jgi:tetratricopeptide (TPR) repeat protein